MRTEFVRVSCTCSRRNSGQTPRRTSRLESEGIVVVEANDDVVLGFGGELPENPVRGGGDRRENTES